MTDPGPCIDLPSPADDLVERDFVIRKNGFFYRPDAAGYCSDILDAGRWTKYEAERLTDGVEGATVRQFADFHPLEILTPAIKAEVATLRAQLAAAEAKADAIQIDLGNEHSSRIAAESQLASARNDAFQECIAIAEKYSDCGSDFIAQKIRDLALSQTTGGE